MFQFLIGSLESWYCYWNNTRSSRFQFLIGSLESPYPPTIADIRGMFQFLIGSLESIKEEKEMKKVEIVSIPYR